jgi:hypothetical protein
VERIQVFNFLKKYIVEAPPPALPEGIDFYIKDVPGAIEVFDGFSRVHWSKINEAMKRYSQLPAINEIWTELAAQWLGLLWSHLGKDYEVYEGKRLLMLSSHGEDRARRLFEFADPTFDIMERTLALPPETRQRGKHAFLVLKPRPLFQDYLRYFLPQENPASLMTESRYIWRGYRHTVINGEGQSTECALAWGYAYHLTSLLPLPEWVRTGSASYFWYTMDPRLVFYPSVFLGSARPAIPLDNSEVRLQRRYWFWFGIDRFWDGSAFHSSSSPGVSCKLALVLFHNLASDPRRAENLPRFLTTANKVDGGAAACERCFGFSLSDLVAEFLGSGPWEPSSKVPGYEHRPESGAGGC